MINQHRQRTYSYVKQDRFILDSCEDSAVWAGSADASAITTSTDHKEGTVALKFSKTGTSEASVTITRTLTSAQASNIVDYIHGKLRLWMKLSSLTNVASVQLLVGSSFDNGAIYQVDDTSLQAGWNELTFDIDSPDAIAGNGASWSGITFYAIRVNFDSAANTLADIIVDALSVFFEVTADVRTRGKPVTALLPDNATVGTNSSVALTKNAKRAMLTLVNQSANDMWYAWDVAAEVDKGTLLKANGGSVLFDAAIPTGELNVIAAGASSNLCIQEYISNQ